MVKYIVLFMEMHQPRRLNRLLHYQAFNEPLDLIFDDELDKLILNRISSKSYLKVFEILRWAHRSYGFRFAVSMTGLLAEQLARWRRDVLEEFSRLISEGVIEPIAETYYHSLAYLIDIDEFRRQINDQVKLIEDLSGVKPYAAQNTEFMYSDEVGKILSEMGFGMVLTEGVERILGFRWPTYVYKGPGGIRLLLRHYRLSDDIGFRFSSRWWDQYPLTADKYATWLKATGGDLVMIGLDMETFGEHMPEETGIFEFLRWLFRHAYEWGLEFIVPSEVPKYIPNAYDLNVNELISWADVEKDASAWVGNEMQWTALNQITLLYNIVKELGDEYLLRYVRLLMVSDHFYYMSTKHGPAGEVHSYFNPYYSPFRAYTLYQAALHRLYSHIVETHGPGEVLKVLSEVKLPSELSGWVRGKSFKDGQCEAALYTARLMTLNYPKIKVC